VDDTAHDEEQLGRLLRVLEPAPDAWVPAAAELPAARRALAEIGPRVLDDADRRAAQIAQLEAALRDAGYEPTPALVEALRRDLQRGGER
jgi:hypothetical protein